MAATKSKFSYPALALATVLGAGGGGLSIAGLADRFTDAAPQIADSVGQQLAEIVVAEFKAQSQSRHPQVASGPRTVPPSTPPSDTITPPEASPPSLPAPTPPAVPPPLSEPTPEDFTFQDDPETEARPDAPESACEPCPSERMAARAICAVDTNTGLYSLRGQVYFCLTDLPADE